MLAKFTGWGLLALIRLLTGAQARWWGCPPKAEQRIYFANHQSHLDLVMIWAALPEELRSITRPMVDWSCHGEARSTANRVVKLRH